MKNILDWMKGHVAVVVLTAVILLTIPSAFAVSSMLNSNLRKAREAEVNKDLKELDTAGTVYKLPAVIQGGEAIELSVPAPSETITTWFREQRKARDAQVEEVVKMATQINSEGHELIIEGLFPAPPAGDSEFKRLEFLDLLIGKGEYQGVYEGLFAEHHAGGPADPVRVAEEVRDIEARELERHRAEFGQQPMTPQQREEINKKVVGQRLGRYQKRASEITVYAVLPDCLPAKQLPRKSFNEPQDLWQCFEWQWDYWVVRDILRAVLAANTGPDGKWAPVDKAAVKRIEKVSIERLPVGEPSMNDTLTPTGSEKAPLDPLWSITGRRTSKGNLLYDVRAVDLDVIIDSARVADLINAISRTNFMTVIGCELREADPWRDLEDGYYYGGDHVMRARIKVETVWLRSWTQPLMPEELKIALGIAATPEGATAAEAAPPPPPVRRAVRNEDEPTQERGTGGRRVRDPGGTTTRSGGGDGGGGGGG